MAIKFLENKELTVDLGKFWQETKEVVRTPKQFFASHSSKKKQATLQDLVIYFVLITLVGSLLGLIYSFAIRPLLTQVLPQYFPAFATVPTVVESLSILAVGIIMVVLLSFVWTGALHGWFRLFKGKGSYKDSYLVFAYSRAPLSLFGWIPFIGGLAGLYTLYLLAVGAHTFHGFSMRKSVLLVVPVVILVIILQVVSYALLVNAS